MTKKKSKKHKTEKYQNPKTELIGLDPILDLISLALWTTYIHGERIVSLLLLAPPESGKTEVMKKFRKNRGVNVRRRFTACGIIKDLISNKIQILFEGPKILGHIFTYELANVFTYKANSVDSTIEFLNALIEEGLESETSYWIEGDELDKFKNLKGGIVAGINPFGFFTSFRTKLVKANLYKGGFISRLLVVSFSNSKIIDCKISNSITSGEYRTDKSFRKLIIEDFPRKRVKIYIKKSHASQIEVLASEIAIVYGEDLKTYALKGFRLQKSLVSFVKASALRDGRRVVNDRDVQRIVYLSRYLNLKMNELDMDYPFSNRQSCRNFS